MVNLPGSANVVAPNVYSTLVFTPTPGAAATVSVWNNSMHTVYVGKAGVNQADGFAIQPGNRPVRLQNITYPLYAVSDVSVGAATGTIGSSAVTAGSTAISLSAAVPSGLAAGTTVVIGSTVNNGWEAQVVASTTASSQITFATPLVSDHANGQPVYVATALPGSVVAQAGVV